MSKLNEDEINNEIVIDFHQLRNPELRESFLSAFGHMIKGLLGSIFGPNEPPRTRVRGERREVAAFAQALKDEGNYIRTLQRYDLDNPRTHKNKAKLKNSVKKFEKETGVKWPFAT